MVDNAQGALELLKLESVSGASDMYISAGRPPTLRKGGGLERIGGHRLTPDGTESIIKEMYGLAGRDMKKYAASGDDDFSLTVPGLARFRVNAYMQRGTMSAVIRVVKFGIPDHGDMSIPELVMSAAEERNGLVLVTGPAGSGKTTTLACIIDRINKTREAHIITLEDPIEYLHKDDKSFINQREVYTDTKSYMTALKAALREAPDVILLGEMRDHETVRAAITAAETGELVISTLHTLGAALTVDRIIDMFPPDQHAQVRMQLSMALRMVISQKLVQGTDGGLVPIFEVMRANGAISNIIREGKAHQIDNVIHTSKSEGMTTLGAYAKEMHGQGRITREVMFQHLGKSGKPAPYEEP